MRLAFVALALWSVNSWAIADEISDLFYQQRKQRIAAERAAERAAKRRSRRPTKTPAPKKEAPESKNPASLAAHGITEIDSECPFGRHGSPVYTLIVKSDGTFRFEGRYNVDHIGEWTGTIDRKAFNELAEFIRDAGYMEFQDMYFNDAPHITPLYTMVVQDGKRHVIEDSDTGPGKLKEIERRIYALLDGAQWAEQPAEAEAKSDGQRD